MSDYNNNNKKKGQKTSPESNNKKKCSGKQFLATKYPNMNLSRGNNSNKKRSYDSDSDDCFDEIYPPEDRESAIVAAKRANHPAFTMSSEDWEEKGKAAIKDWEEKEEAKLKLDEDFDRRVLGFYEKIPQEKRDMKPCGICNSHVIIVDNKYYLDRHNHTAVDCEILRNSFSNNSKRESISFKKTNADDKNTSSK